MKNTLGRNTAFPSHARERNVVLGCGRQAGAGAPSPEPWPPIYPGALLTQQGGLDKSHHRSLWETTDTPIPKTIMTGTVVACAYNPTLRKLKEDGYKFKVTLG